MKKILSIFVVSFALVFSSNLFANKIGVIYDSGGKFDKSFNELAFRTAERVKNELGWDMIEFEAAKNIKRTWCLKNIDWFDTRAEGEMFLDAATETKSVWIPYGEG